MPMAGHCARTSASDRTSDDGAGQLVSNLGAASSALVRREHRYRLQDPKRGARDPPRIRATSLALSRGCGTLGRALRRASASARAECSSVRRTALRRPQGLISNPDGRPVRFPMNTGARGVWRPRSRLSAPRRSPSSGDADRFEPGARSGAVRGQLLLTPGRVRVAERIPRFVSRLGAARELWPRWPLLGPRVRTRRLSFL
jgi:hypothetical protein